MAKSITGNVQETAMQGTNDDSEFGKKLAALRAQMNTKERDKLVAETQGWAQERIGFAPYWTPTEGDFFIGVPVAKDDKDPEFIRFLFVAEHDIICARGPVDNAEPVLVRKGEEFSMSDYFQLSDALSFYLECGFPVRVKIRAKEKVKTKTAGQQVWLFDMSSPPDVRKKLDEKKALMRGAMAGQLPQNAGA